jgi:hypothetical protein
VNIIVLEHILTINLRIKLYANLVVRSKFELVIRLFI